MGVRYQSPGSKKGMVAGAENQSINYEAGLLQ